MAEGGDAGERRSACPLCGGPGAPALATWDRNRETTAERFRYDRCRRCATLFLTDVPADLARYYDGDYHGFDERGDPPWKANESLRRVEGEHVALLRRHVEPGRLIEVGAGAGGFAAAARDAGFGVTAIEMDARCCEYMRSALGVEAIQSDQPTVALRGQQPARVIALWQVLEHLPDPREMLECAAAKLERGGVLALGVPNPGSLQFRLLRSRWAHLDAPRHLSLSPAAALIEHGRELGLECLELTTDDTFARLCNQFGWETAIVRRPSRQPHSHAVARAARALTILAAPLEHSGRRGTTVTLLLRRSG